MSLRALDRKLQILRDNLSTLVKHNFFIGGYLVDA